ncbi:hypothetical protein [Haloferula sp.]|uniref:hypothetical protein n=1 Tax=Haloferula sp. TaxID=2497595 RepID=UPI00329DD31C
MSALDRLKLSFRCPADWEAMEGDERKRFCSHCQKDVHNLSAMSRAEAATVVAEGSRLCVRMLRRADGSLVTKGCPKTVSARGQAVRRLGAGLAAGSALALASCDDPQHAVGVLPAPPEEATVPADEEHEIIGDFVPPNPAIMGEMCPVEELDAAGGGE